MAIGCPKLISNSRPVSRRDGASTSRMAYLRERYTSEMLSEEATYLLFGKWNSWCCEWGSDPISGPTTELLKFLADLHKQGYQYCSYWSTISSVHEEIDGHSY